MTSLSMQCRKLYGMRVHCYFWLVLLVSCIFPASAARLTRSRVCIVTCDFWGLPAAGGTATAYHLLASSLADTGKTKWPVMFLAATSQTELCHELQQNFSSGHVQFTCLEQHHFHPQVVENHPYESIGNAVVRWLKSEGKGCDIIHAHEWGGGMQQLAAFVSMRHKLNRRLIVEPHGGHYWSTQGTRQRPTDLHTLRIDDHERLTLQLADDVKSPSAYMLAHLRQRGWLLPPQASVLPNIVPQAVVSSTVRQEKLVWRLAFFGRLEERKGLKLFCEAIEMLPSESFPRLDIMFIGGEAHVDMKPSVKYLQDRTAMWPWPVNILGGMPRRSALSLLKADGVLIVFASLVENLPFALAEACVEEIPFITFNVGGVSELFDPALHTDVIVSEISAPALSQRMQLALTAGYLRTSVLTSNVRHGETLWHSLHLKYDSHNPPSRKPRFPNSLEGIEILQTMVKHNSMLLKGQVCTKSPRHPALLLVPAEFASPSQTELAELKFLASQLPRLRTSRKLGALVFGAQVADGLVSYPSSPTWITYHGKEPFCVEDSPLLILTDVFCSDFLAEAGDFPYFRTWLLIKHLKLSGLSTTAYPDPLFLLRNFSRSDSGCFSDRIPEFRKLSGDHASNLLGPSEEVLMVQHLAAWPRPVASLRNDFDKFQGQHGWQYVRFDENGKALVL